MDPVWRLVEACHAVVYYADERSQEYGGIGLKGGWMGYFASRAAALGPVGPEVVTALFHGFAESMVARALPDAWRYASPEAALAARWRVADRALRRVLGDAVAGPEVARAADLAGRAAAACPLPGRPMAAAHGALPVPDEPHLALFHATSVLREFRGDGHVVALVHAGIDGCEAHVLTTALGLVPADQRRYRGWSDDDWAAAVDRLRDRGWVHPDRVALTARGREARGAVEADTDRLAAPALAALGPHGVGDLAAALAPLARRVGEAGAVPYPNGMGTPPPAGAHPRAATT